MRRLLAISMGLVVCASVAVAAELTSGLQVGDGVPAFNVRNVTGQECADFAKAKEDSLCYRCKFSAFPTACVFTRTVDSNLTGLIKQIDSAVAKDESKKLRAFVVVITDDPDKTSKELEALAKKENIKNVPLTLVEGPAGPPEYKIAKEAEVTVLGWNGPVKFNHAYAKGGLNKDGVQKIIADVQKLAAK